MPIYEYTCTKCDHRLEALQKMSDAPLLDCPACAKPALMKLVSAASFRLKGGGWYETDFKTGDKKQLADSDSGSSDSGKSGNDAGTSGGDAAKSDAKESKTPNSSAKNGDQGGGSKSATADKSAKSTKTANSSKEKSKKSAS